ncbi:MAG: hypothetical protein GY765_23480, partial [bacterium]|nr:hypothetical protein [bacterium]
MESDSRRVKHLPLMAIPMFFLIFLAFLSFHQRHAVSHVKRQIAEYVTVIGPFLWNYDQSYMAYLNLVAQEKAFASIEVHDAMGYVSGRVEGDVPTWYEQWLTKAKLIP